MVEKYLKTNKKITYQVVYIIGFIIMLLLSKSCYNNFNPNNYSDASYMIGVVFFLLFAIVCLYSLLSVKDYYVYNKKIVWKSFFGINTSIINFEEIESWTEIQKKDKYNSWEVLSLFTKAGTEIKISSYYYANFHQIKSKVVKNKIRNFNIERQKLNEENKKYSISFIIIGLIFLFIACKFIQITDVDPSELIVFGDVTSKNIKLLKGTRSSNRIIIELNKYPNFEFQVSGTSLDETYAEDLINNVKEGDSIFLGIYKTEFRKKLIKTDSLSLIDKYFHYELIHIESIKTSTFEYLKLSKNNNGRTSNKYWGFGFFGVVGLFLFIVGIYMFQDYKKEKTATNSGLQQLGF